MTFLGEIFERILVSEKFPQNISKRTPSQMSRSICTTIDKNI